MSKKTNTKEKVRCIDCKVGVLIQWDNNPVIVNCRRMQDKDVASTPRLCEYFKPNGGRPEILKKTHYI